MGSLINVWHALALAVEPPLRLCCDPSDPLPFVQCVGVAASFLALVGALLWIVRGFGAPGRARALLVSLMLLVAVNFYPLTVSALVWVSRGVLDRALGRLAVLAAVAAAGVAVWRVVRYGSEEHRRNAVIVANALATTVLATTAWTGMAGWVNGKERRGLEAARRLVERSTQRVRVPVDRPDVYYVILDGYGRQDVLAADYGVDNRDFLGFLESRGFTVARAARSNYVQTYLSLASALNVSYLDAVAVEHPATRRPLRYLIEQAAVFRMFKAAGYRLVFLRSLYAATRNAPLGDQVIDDGTLGPWFYYTVAVTPFWLAPPVSDFQHDQHRRGVLRALSELPRVTMTAGPKFVFAHVMSPHPPFVLDPARARTPYALNDGTHFYGSREDYVRGYGTQITRLNGLLRETVDALISAIPPGAIVILQSDHGPGSSFDWLNYEKTNLRERSGILAAYRVPEPLEKDLYPTITPINAWRTILRHLFQADYPALPDRTYYSPWTRPYEFREVAPEAISFAAND